jgi:hypothetical protein
MPGIMSFDDKNKDIFIGISSCYNQEEHEPVRLRQREMIENGERASHIRRLIHDIHRYGSMMTNRRQQIEDDLIEEWLCIASLKMIDDSSTENSKASKCIHNFSSYERQKRMTKSNNSKARVKSDDGIFQ